MQDADDTAALTEAFWSVARRLRTASRDSLARWDITPSQSRALSVMARHDPMRLRALSDHLRIAARSGTEVVDALEENDLVDRRPDPSDRRATLVGLTEKGSALADELSAARKSEADAYFARLSPTDRKNLARILRKLLDD